MKLLSMEFTQKSIFLYQIQTQGKQVVVEREIVLDMPENAYYNGVIVNNDRAVSDIIRKCLLENKIDAKKTICTISTTDCMQEELSVLTGKNKQMDGMIREELIKRKKINNDYIYEYEILGDDDLKPGYVKVRAYICPKGMIQNYYDVIKKAGLRPYRFELTSRIMEDIAKRANLLTSQDYSILICVHPDEAHFMYVGGNETPYYRYAGSKKNHAMEENIYILSDMMSSYQADETQEIISVIVENLTRLSRFHAQRHRDKEIGKVFIYGSHEDIPELAKGVENAAGVLTVPMNYRSFEADVHYRRQDSGYRYNGLAAIMKTLASKKTEQDFFMKLEETLKGKKDFKMFLPSIVGGAFLVLILTAAISMSGKNRTLQKEIDAMNQYINDPVVIETYNTNAKWMEQIEEYRSYNEMCDRYIQVLQQMPQISRKYFQQVQAVTPKEITITNYGYAQGVLTLSCIATNQHAPADYTEALSKEGFYKVDYTGFQKSIGMNGNEIYTFYITIDMWE